MFRHKFSTISLVAAFLLVCCLLFPQAASAQPGNDNRSDATLIPAIPYDEWLDTTSATLAPDDPFPSCLPYWEIEIGNTVWYSFTPAETRPVIFLMDGSDYSTVVTVYQEGEYGLGELACGTGNLGLNAQAQQTYFIMVAAWKWAWDPYPGPLSGGQLHFQLQNVSLQPNDSFSTAEPILSTPASFLDVDAFASTVEIGEPAPSCLNGGSIHNTLWYSYTAGETGRLIIRHNYYNYESVMTMYQGDALESLSETGCYQGYVTASFDVTAGETYYVQIGSVYNLSYPGAYLGITVEFVTPPPNDSFGGAEEIPGIPYTGSVDTTWASLEAGEPTACAEWYGPGRTVWYSFTPTETAPVWLRRNSWNFTPFMAVYVGPSLDQLTGVSCRMWGEPVAFRAEAGQTYYIQIGGIYGEGGLYDFLLDYTPPPQVSIGFNIGDPSIYDTLYFWSYVDDPLYMEITDMAWDFGDGGTSVATHPTHRYAADGDYTVSLAVTLMDGRTASTSTVVSVRTHDVTIVRFSLPTNVKVNQTRPVDVYVASPRYPEVVAVEIYKSTPYGWEWFGALRQTVPVGSLKNPTKFSFNYTFTQQDLLLGKVNFRAVANLIDARDAAPADNEAISLPVIVKK